MEEYNPHAIYNKKILFLLIPIVGIFIALMYMFDIHVVHKYLPLIHVLHSVFITAGIWLGCYTIVTFLWRTFPWEFYPLKHLVFEIVLIVVYTNAFAYVSYILALSNGIIDISKQSTHIFSEILITNLITFFITAIHEAIFFYKQWKFNFSKSVQLEKEHLQATFDSLKNQMQPHFLFNSLNALSTMVYDNITARNYIQNLSEFLRYILMHSHHELVVLEKEFAFTKKYLEIQQTRYGASLQIQYNISDNYLAYEIPPIVLQTLVENCIKHNIISSEKPLKITIQTADESIVIHNNYQKRDSENSTGQGLQNIIQRYAYVSPRQIKIQQSATDFSVEIPLIPPKQ